MVNPKTQTQALLFSLRTQLRSQMPHLLTAQDPFREDRGGNPCGLLQPIPLLSNVSTPVSQRWLCYFKRLTEQMTVKRCGGLNWLRQSARRHKRPL